MVRASSATPASGATELDRSGTTPLHAQIAQWLRDEIRDRGWVAGTALPSEAQLGERFGVARSVVRQALASLVSEGTIVRQAGRAPFVAPAREHHRLVQRSTGMFDQFARTGVRLRTRVLSIARQVPPAEVAAFFESDDLLFLERLRYVGDEPLALVSTWLPGHLADRIDSAALTDTSLHGLLEARADLRPGKGRNRIKAVAASVHQAEQLRVPAGSPLLLLEGLGRDQHDRPLEYFFTWHRSEHLVFDVDVTGEDEQIRRSLPQGRVASGQDAQAGAHGFAPEPAASASPSGVSPSDDSPLARAERLLAELSLELQRLKQGDCAARSS